MNRKERRKLIAKAKIKLELIKDMRHSIENYDDKANKYVYCNFNFSDVYEYFRETFELIDIETDKEIPLRDSFFRFFGLLQIIYVHQDLTDAIAKVFGVNLENGSNKTINRDLRNQLIGHPLSNERVSKERNKKNYKEISDKIQSTIILKNITSKTFHYICYNPENETERYSDKNASIDDILTRHIDFLNEVFDVIIVKCFEEIQRQVSKLEKYINKYFNEEIPEIAKYRCWFKEYFNFTSFEYEILRYCESKKHEHKKYEVYIVEFERMIVVSYIEMVDRFKSFHEKLQSIGSTDINIKFNNSMIESLTMKQIEVENYFPKSDNHTIGHDLIDISKPFNDLWDVGFNRLSRIFSNEAEVINELNNLKMIKSNGIEYEISYRYIQFLVGYS